MEASVQEIIPSASQNLYPESYAGNHLEINPSSPGVSPSKPAQVIGSTTKSLMGLLADHHQATALHCIRVGELALDFYIFLVDRGYAPVGRSQEVVKLALMHDVGKLTIDADLLNFRGPLTVDEWASFQRHARAGEELLRLSGASLWVQEGVLHHHERFDGQGYPEGLSGLSIPWPARFIAIVDAFDAMTDCKRQYRDQVQTREKAIHEIRENAGAQFCPSLSRAFIEFIEGS